VVWLPLSPAARAQFNTTAAWEWFQQIEGANYGARAHRIASRRVASPRAPPLTRAVA
jgi:hypothetical protein